MDCVRRPGDCHSLQPRWIRSHLRLAGPIAVALRRWNRRRRTGQARRENQRNETHRRSCRDGGGQTAQCGQDADERRTDQAGRSVGPAVIALAAVSSSAVRTMAGSSAA